MEILNCTPHAISVINEKGETIVFPPSGIIPRVSTERVIKASLGGFRVVESKLGIVEGLPPQKPEVYLIVSNMVLQAAASRSDLIAPDTGAPDAVREKGQVIAVHGFIC